MIKISCAIFLATVTVLGASLAMNLSVSNIFYSTNSNIPDIECNGHEFSCGFFYGDIWDKPTSDPSRLRISLEQLETLYYNL